MAQIKPLPELLSNQIAAGEVVERPASVVKELVENAIDANSRQIDVWVEEAGLRSIKVIDDGDGIPADEVLLALERHATSKIYTKEDLFRIHSLGFRGEALPSISSVAKVTIETCQDGQAGKFVKVSGGELQEERPHSARKGTTIHVEDLFFNTPARLKYVRSIQTELANITDIMNRLALSHPEVAFRFLHEGNELMRTSGNGDLKQAIAGVYGPATARKMAAIAAENLDFQLSGFVSFPDTTRASRNYITFVLNGRYIRNYQLQKAVVEGYGSKLMVGRFPVAVIRIDTDPLLLDVNVHPSKREVRISKERELGLLITQAIQAAIRESSHVPSGLENLSFRKKSSFRPVAEQLQVELGEGVQEPAPEFLASPSREHTHPKPPSSLENTAKQDVETGGWTASSTGNLNENKQPVVPIPNAPLHDEPIKVTLKKVEREELDKGKGTFPTLYYFGRMHGTYLFAENEKGLYIVDQHAAQERIKYEYYREEIAKVSPHLQELLVPITLDLPLNEYMAVQENKEQLEKIGIFLEPFGHQTLLLEKHPTWFPPGQEEKILEEILTMLLEEGEVSLQKLREATAIMMSCKRSIKANHHLSEPEARQLLEDLAKCQNPYNCPHGRPVLIHFSSSDMEKMFKRIQDPH